MEIASKATKDEDSFQHPCMNCIHMLRREKDLDNMLWNHYVSLQEARTIPPQQYNNQNNIAVKEKYHFQLVVEESAYLKLFFVLYFGKMHFPPHMFLKMFKFFITTHFKVDTIYIYIYII